MLVDVENGEAVCVFLGMRSVLELSLPSAHFCCEPKPALKSNIYFQKITVHDSWLDQPPHCPLKRMESPCKLCKEVLVLFGNHCPFREPEDSMNSLPHPTPNKKALAHKHTHILYVIAYIWIAYLCNSIICSRIPKKPSDPMTRSPP